MDSYEKVGYACLGLVALIYVVTLFALGARVGWFGGIIGLLLVVGIGVLLIKVVGERRRNREDDSYARNIEK